MENFKNKIVFLSFLTFLVIPMKLIAQRSHIHHYACAVDSVNKLFYISSNAKVIFMSGYNYETEAHLPEEMERQFLNYIVNHTDKDLSEHCIFVSFKMSKNKKLIKKEIKKQTKKYETSKYKIVILKNFSYD